MWRNILSRIFPCCNWQEPEPPVRAQNVAATLTVEIVIEAAPEEQLQPIPVPRNALPSIEYEPSRQAIWRKLMPSTQGVYLIN
ncbi:uncharacterized protein Dmoj_GI26991 [Drosophila mojavensis]|uniref:Uncharacterized protein n=1 Tax=Drosophila mojavensis TaxID=7230 RepID=A0A0Q9WMJ5_DROMO|nr:uncharacterized protein Dmoj_GI26991 [Drosophila mojavensis]